MFEPLAELFQGRVVPSNPGSLCDCLISKVLVILEFSNPAVIDSAGLRAHRHFVTSHELLASPIAGSVPSGNR